jgi:hypothetical protein
VKGSLFLNRFPAVYRRERDPYRPVSVREVDLLDEICRLERLNQEMLRSPSAERNRLTAEPAHLTAELAHLTAELARVTAERDRAIRYPWKYFGQAWRLRRPPAR